MPSSTYKILDILSVKKENRTLKSVENIKFLKPGTIIKKSDILFKKVENDN